MTLNEACRVLFLWGFTCDLCVSLTYGNEPTETGANGSLHTRGFLAEQLAIGER